MQCICFRTQQENLNETKQEIREIQAKKNKLVAGGNTSLDGDNISGNPESFFNSTNKRLERLENESRNLIEDFDIIEKAAKNLSRTELKVRAHKIKLKLRRCFSFNWWSITALRRKIKTTTSLFVYPEN